MTQVCDEVDFREKEGDSDKAGEQKKGGQAGGAMSQDGARNEE